VVPGGFTSGGIMMYGVGAAIGAALLLPFLIAIARRVGLIDRPTGGRKRHSGDVPLVGGLAIYGTLVLFAALGVPGIGPFTLLAGLALLAGVVDDKWHLPPVAKLLLQFGIATLAVASQGQTMGSLGDIVGLGSLTLGAAGPVAAVLFYVTLMNAINLIDGADGVAGGVSCVMLAALAGLGALTGAREFVPMIVVLGAIGGFLCYNLPVPGRARPLAFLGEGGGMLIGFTLAWAALGLHAVDARLPPVLIGWVVALPIIDMACVAVGRLTRGHSPFTPGRDHLHHLFLDRGTPALYAAFAVSGLSLLFAGGAIAGEWLGLAQPILFAALLAAGVGYAAATHTLRRGPVRAVRGVGASYPALPGRLSPRARVWVDAQPIRSRSKVANSERAHAA
jgi:UDP-GlcNAc:undecaprenyl-phosphate GlcNAc-1-phosphate transferase